MLHKVLSVLVPPFIGFIIVIGLVEFQGIIRHFIFPELPDIKIDPDLADMFLYTTISVALVMQFAIACPAWDFFKTQKRIFKRSIIQFIIFTSLSGGVFFGLIFSETDFGMQSFILSTLFGASMLVAYWVANLFILQQIDRTIG